MNPLTCDGCFQPIQDSEARIYREAMRRCDHGHIPKSRPAS